MRAEGEGVGVGVGEDEGEVVDGSLAPFAHVPISCVNVPWVMEADAASCAALLSCRSCCLT